MAFYGFSDLVCVDAITGQEVWHTNALHTPKWVGDGLYTADSDGLARWA